MINDLYRRLNRPERGWDPISPEHATQYAVSEWNRNPKLLEWVRSVALKAGISEFCNLRVLDLGGGPGQFAGFFAAEGAQVTWYDVSAVYRELAQKRIESEHPQTASYVNYVVGYLDEISDAELGEFDLVFSRLAWCYSANESRFATSLVRSLKEDGLGIVITGTGLRQPASVFQHILYLLNAKLRAKVGHPQPPRGRVTQLLRKLGVEILDEEMDGSTEWIAFRRKI